MLLNPGPLTEHNKWLLHTPHKFHLTAKMCPTVKTYKVVFRDTDFVGKKTNQVLDPPKVSLRQRD